MTEAARTLESHGWWLASRASGVVALVLVTVSVAIGLAMAGKVLRVPGLSRKLMAIHEQTALAGLIAICVHAITLLGDPFLDPGVAGVAVPFAIDFETFFTGLGVIAAYLALLLGLSYYARRRIGARTWRRAHRDRARLRARTRARARRRHRYLGGLVPLVGDRDDADRRRPLRPPRAGRACQGSRQSDEAEGRGGEARAPSRAGAEAGDGERMSAGTVIVGAALRSPVALQGAAGGVPGGRPVGDLRLRQSAGQQLLVGIGTVPATGWLRGRGLDGGGDPGRHRRPHRDPRRRAGPPAAAQLLDRPVRGQGAVRRPAATSEALFSRGGVPVAGLAVGRPRAIPALRKQIEGAGLARQPEKEAA